ncbi:MAG: ATP-grasp domain-containing protein [Fimbriiglobus sp.]
MKFAVLSGGTGWHVQDLLRAATELGHSATALDFRRLAANVRLGHETLADFDCLLIRTMPAGSLEQVVFRMDLLHEAEARGQMLLNPPRAVEVCVDKYLTSARLARAGLPTPMTVVCQDHETALQAWHVLGKDVVVKPLFGAEGRGMLRLQDEELAWRTFRALEEIRAVMYLQEFIHHPGWDLRLFVLGDQVLGAMRREAHADWRTNVAQGGTASQHPITADIAELALAASQAVGAKVAGVDLLPLPNGGWTVLEVNGVPGWAAFAKVCEMDVAREIIRYAANGVS